MAHALEVLQPVVALHRRGWSPRAILAAVFLVGSVVATALSGGNPVELVLAAIPAVPAAILAITAARRFDVSRSNALDMLLRNPKRIVWFYADDIQGAVRRCVYLQLSDGSTLPLPNIPHQDVPAVMRALQQHLPHAVVGYSDTRRQRYGTNPRMVAVNVSNPGLPMLPV